GGKGVARLPIRKVEGQHDSPGRIAVCLPRFVVFRAIFLRLRRGEESYESLHRSFETAILNSSRIRGDSSAIDLDIDEYVGGYANKFMSINHIVAQGETLSSIANQYGFHDWRTIYDHPDNSNFRERRKDPNLLYPGETLIIPDKQQQEIDCQVGQKHQFKMR